MSAHMKKPLTKKRKANVMRMRHRNQIYAIPRHIAEQYRVCSSKEEEPSVNAEAVFFALDQKFTKPGALLRGLRYRENLNQTEFAKKIKVSQADLSKMENGKRPIGKIIAKRIEALFGMNYRSFLD